MVGWMIAVAAMGVFPVALALASLSDLSTFRIPNGCSLALIASFLAAAVASGGYGQAVLAHGVVGVAVFVAGAVLFWMRVWGGGDAKLLAAVSLWVGLLGLPRLLMVMALTGGVLALALDLLRRSPVGKRRRYQLLTGGHVPYGVAISVAGLDWWLREILPIVMGGGS